MMSVPFLMGLSAKQTESGAGFSDAIIAAGEEFHGQGFTLTDGCFNVRNALKRFFVLKRFSGRSHGARPRASSPQAIIHGFDAVPQPFPSP